MKVKNLVIDGVDHVKDFLEGLQKKDRAKVERQINLLDMFGVKWGPPNIKALQGHGLYYLRVVYRRNTYRIFFLVSGDQECLVLLHGFAKHTQKTPRNEIEIALKRKEAFLKNY